MSAKPFKVLLIEDDPDDALLVELFVGKKSKASFTLVQATHLQGALTKLAQEEIDVILLDLELPDCHGLDTFRAVHARAAHIPIVILSGADEEQNALEAVRAGAQDYLVKGKTDSQELVRALRFAIGRAARLGQETGPDAPVPGGLAEFSSHLAKLTFREREVFDHLIQGRSLKQICLDLGTSYHTVKNQRGRIMEKMQVQSESQLVRLALLSQYPLVARISQSAQVRPRTGKSVRPKNKVVTDHESLAP